MTLAREVRTEHIGGELLLVDFPGFAILSDHPEAMGGTGRGPMPGELLKGALAASAVFAMVDAGIAAEGAKVACGSDTATERREDGPLPSLTVLSRFVLAIVGDPDAALEAVIRDCTIARILTGEVTMTERNAFLAAERHRDARSTTFLIDGMKANRPATGETRVRQAAESSQVTAEYIGEGRVLLCWARTSFVVDRETVAPEELMLAALCACTSVFSARSAAMVDAGVEITVTCSGDFGEPVPRIEKSVAFTGAFDERQREVLAYCADNCAIGETLRRQARLDVVFDRSLAVICDDGACCIAEHAAPL